MKVQLNNKEYVFKFRHLRPDPISEEVAAVIGRVTLGLKPKDLTKVLNKGRFKKGTICTVFTGDAELVKAESRLHPDDQFRKASGRKAALSKALESAGFSRKDRQKVWQEYLKTHKV